MACTYKYKGREFDSEQDVMDYINIERARDSGNILPAEIMMPLPKEWLPKLYKKYKDTKRYLTDKPDGAFSMYTVVKLLNEDILKGVANTAIEVKGLRIPNQQVSSNDFFTVKKFLPPTSLSSVVVPSAIVVKTGSDFDIDKQSLYFYETDENLNIIEPKNTHLTLEEITSELNYTKQLYDDAKLVYNEKVKAHNVEYGIYKVILKDYLREKHPLKQVDADIYDKLESTFGADLFTYGYETHIGHAINKLQGLIGTQEFTEDELFTINHYITELKKTGVDADMRESKDLLDKAREELRDAKARLNNTKERYYRLKQVKKNYPKELANEMLNIERRLLLSKYNAHNLLAPIIDDVWKVHKDKTLKRVQEDIYRETQTTTNYDGQGTLAADSASFMTNLFKSLDNIRSKQGVGVVARGVTAKALFQIYNTILQKTETEEYIKFENADDFYSYLGGNMIDGSHQYDTDLNSIMENLSGLLSAQVDAAKDPYIASLGSNLQTLGMFNLLLVQGYTPSFVVKLFAQPIIKEYLRTQSLYESFLYEETREADNALAKLQKRENERARNRGQEPRNIKKQNLYVELVHEKFPEDSEQVEVITEDMLDSQFDSRTIQREILSQFISLNDMSKKFRVLFNYLTADTTGRKNIGEVTAFLENREQAIAGDALISKNSLIKLESDSMLTGFYQAQLENYNLFKRLYLTEKDSELSKIFKYMTSVYSSFHSNANIKNKIATNMRLDFALFLMQQADTRDDYLFNKYEAKELLYGDTSIPNIIKLLNNGSAQDLDEVREALQDEPYNIFVTDAQLNILKNSQFIKAMVANIEAQQVPIDIKSPKKESNVRSYDTLEYFNQDDIIEDINDIIEDLENIKDMLPSFYKGLVAFNYYQGGVTYSRYNLSRLFPAEERFNTAQEAMQMTWGNKLGGIAVGEQSDILESFFEHFQHAYPYFLPSRANTLKVALSQMYKKIRYQEEELGLDEDLTELGVLKKIMPKYYGYNSKERTFRFYNYKNHMNGATAESETKDLLYTPIGGGAIKIYNTNQVDTDFIHSPVPAYTIQRLKVEDTQPYVKSKQFEQITPEQVVEHNREQMGDLEYNTLNNALQEGVFGDFITTKNEVVQADFISQIQDGRILLNLDKQC